MLYTAKFVIIFASIRNKEFVLRKEFFIKRNGQSTKKKLHTTILHIHSGQHQRIDKIRQKNVQIFKILH
jgi:hypothetical protein